MKFLALALLAAVASARGGKGGRQEGGAIGGNRDGNRGGKRGGKRGGRPEGSMAFCKIPMVEDDEDAIRGGIKFFQADPVEGEENLTSVKAKFGNLDSEVATYSVDVYDSEGIASCMDVTAEDLEYDLGTFAPKDRRRGVRGGFKAKEDEATVLDGEDSIIGQYVALSAGDQILACCTVELKVEEADEDDEDDEADEL